MRIRILMFLLFAFITVCANAQSNQNYVTSKVSDNVYQFCQKDFVNMYAVVGNEGVILIDSGLDDLADNVREELKKITDSKIKYLINTHSDYDHIAGNGKLREDAIIISHENCRDELIMYGSPETDIPFDKSHYHKGLPDITFTENMTLHFGNETVHISKMVGGHSSSDLVIWLEKQNVLFTGDIIVPNSFPVVKLHRGSSIKKLKEILAELINKYDEETIVCVGHGKNTTIADLSPLLNMINETENIVTKMINSGLSLEEIKNKNALNDYSEWSGTVFEEVDCNMWIETIYNDFKANN